MHLENLGSWSVSGGIYSIGGTAHIDLFNPDTGFGGIAGHVFVDGAWGHIVQLFGGNIDPKGCPFSMNVYTGFRNQLVSSKGDFA